MSNEEIFKVMQELIAEQFALDSPAAVTMDTSFEDTLDADSVDIVELVMAMEDEFEIETQENELKALKTVGDTVAYIASKINN